MMGDAYNKYVLSLSTEWCF